MPIHLNREGLLAVMIPTVSGLDATELAPGMVLLGDGSDPDPHIAMRRNGTWMAALEDADGDGDTDLVVHFEVPDLVANGDPAPETDAPLLRGQTVGGTRFEGGLPVRVIGR